MTSHVRWRMCRARCAAWACTTQCRCGLQHYRAVGWSNEAAAQKRAKREVMRRRMVALVSGCPSFPGPGRSLWKTAWSTWTSPCPTTRQAASQSSSSAAGLAPEGCVRRAAGRACSRPATHAHACLRCQRMVDHRRPEWAALKRLLPPGGILSRDACPQRQQGRRQGGRQGRSRRAAVIPGCGGHDAQRVRTLGALGLSGTAGSRAQRQLRQPLCDGA